MDSFKPRSKHGPEYYIQDRWVEFLEAKKWHVERLVGNAYQSGIPDLFIGHKDYGCRWVDVKVYGSYNFTKAQRLKWPVWEKYNIGIWILGAHSKEECTTAFMLEEYNSVLFNPPNWRQFWRDSWDQKPDIDKMLEDLEMPVERCQQSGKPGYRWGKEGKCYTYTSGNKSSRDNAKRKAEAQGRAIEANKRK